jgi:hypothetical protein
MNEKKFFRVRLADKSPLPKKMVNGIILTKQWQIKTGDAREFSRFPDVETQGMVKQGNGFVPAEEASGGATGGPDGGSGQSSGPASTPAQDAEGAQASVKKTENPPDFESMTVEQLKNYLIAKGVSQSELRNATKPELIERADFLWSQNR